MNVNWDDLNLEEIETIEELTGEMIDKIMTTKVPKGKMLRALVYVMTKRTNPNFTYAETAKLTLDQGLDMVSGGEDEADPKD